MVLESTYSHHIEGQGKFIKYHRFGGYSLFGMSRNLFLGMSKMSIIVNSATKRGYGL